MEVQGFKQSALIAGAVLVLALAGAGAAFAIGAALESPPPTQPEVALPAVTSTTTTTTNPTTTSLLETTTTSFPAATSTSTSTTSTSTTSTSTVPPSTTTSTTTTSTTTTTKPPPATTTTTKPPPTTTTTTKPPATTTTTTTVVVGGSFSASKEAQFVGLINELRAEVGVSALATDSGLTSYARDWSHTMWETDDFKHSNISTLLGKPWSTVGENIALGWSVQSLFDALKDSPGHYNNMVNESFTHIGVGVWVEDSGRMWTTHVFGG